MGASFVMLKAEGDKGTKGGGEKEHAPEEEAKARAGQAGAASRAESGKREGATGAAEAAEEKCPGSVSPVDPYGMFISYTMSSGAPGLININHVVDAYNEYVTRYGAKEWSALALITDVPDYESMGPRVIRIEDPEEAKKAWETLARASRGKF